MEDLEDLIEGYSNAFDESADIKIETKIHGNADWTFDETFGNVAVKMTQKYMFSNPIEPKYLSAEVTTAVQGVLTLSVNETSDFQFQLEMKQEKVKELKPFFKTETSKEEFEEEFQSGLSKKLLKSFNNELNKGLRLPHSHASRPQTFNKKPSIGFTQNMVVIANNGILVQTGKKMNMRVQKNIGAQVESEYPISFSIGKRDLLQMQ